MKEEAEHGNERKSRYFIAINIWKLVFSNKGKYLKQSSTLVVARNMKSL